MSRLTNKRVFVAIALPDSICSMLAISFFGLRGAKWEPPEKLHLSLRFIGGLPPEAFSELMERLWDISVPSFEMRLKGTGFFPPRGDPRILWAGVAAEEGLFSLQKKLENLLTCGMGLPRDRKYAPHITLARLKNAAHRDVADFLESSALLSSEPFSVNAFHLYSSVLDADGSKYFIEETYPLAPGKDRRSQEGEL